MRKKCFVLFSLLAITLGLSLSVCSRNTNAANIDSAGEFKITSGTITLNCGSTYSGIVHQDRGIDFVSTGQVVGCDGTVYNMVLNTSEPIRGNSLISISGTWLQANGSNTDLARFYGLQTSGNFVILDSNVTNVSGTSNAGVDFSYLIYVKNTTSQLIFGNKDLFNFTRGISYVYISHLTAGYLSADPTAEQINSVIGQMSTINSNISSSLGHISSIDSKINSIINNSDRTADAVEEQNQKDDQDRDNIEEQQGENQDSADDAGSEATSTGTSLFSAFTQLLGALTNISGNDCRLPNIQVYSLNLGSMDLCTYTIPPQIMALVSIGMVFIIVPLGIHLVKKMIALYKEITG